MLDWVMSLFRDRRVTYMEPEQERRRYTAKQAASRMAASLDKLNETVTTSGDAIRELIERSGK